MKIIDNYSRYDAILNNAMHHLFLCNYDAALFSFNDLLEITDDIKYKLLITIKIAQCLSYTNKSESLSLLRSVLRYDDTEVHGYAVKQFEMIDKNAISMKNKNIHDKKYTIMSYFGEFQKKVFL
jgi:hypothetical protein